MTARIQQTESFDASPDQVFDLLMKSENFAAMSGGAPAEIDPQAGGSFSLFGGMITGRNIEVINNRRIVQAWRPGSWDEGVYSLVSFALAEAGGGTTVTFEHSSFPDEEAEHLAQGWHDNYWSNMRAALS